MTPSQERQLYTYVDHLLSLHYKIADLQEELNASYHVVAAESKMKVGDLKKITKAIIKGEDVPDPELEAKIERLRELRKERA